MRIFRSFIGFIHYRSPRKFSRWNSRKRSKNIIFFITIFVIVSYYSILRSHLIEGETTGMIVSLTTTPARFHVELPYTIHSLLSQTQLPQEIRIYLSPASVTIQQRNLTLEYLKVYVQQLDSSNSIEILFDQLVRIKLEVEDYGPATKYLPILKEFRSSTQVLMICDDDQYYHRETLATFNKYIDKYSNSIIGLRGWRVRQDLLWGVSGLYEISYHIVESHYLSEVYQVGVVTANSAYIIRGSFFDSHIHDDFQKVSDAIRHVDDIWLNGHASKRNISRFVVPSCCPSISVAKTHPLEQYLVENKMNRFSANNHALEWFKEYWEQHLWYRFRGKNHPIYRNWLVMIYREIRTLIFNIKFIVYFGFI